MNGIFEVAVRIGILGICLGICLAKRSVFTIFLSTGLLVSYIELHEDLSVLSAAEKGWWDGLYTLVGLLGFLSWLALWWLVDKRKRNHRKVDAELAFSQDEPSRNTTAGKNL